MLIILPILTLAELWLLLVNLDAERAWRKNFLRAAMLCGTWVVICTELLSLGRWLTRPILAVAWLLPVGALAGMLGAIHRKRGLIWQPASISIKQWPHIVLATLLVLTFAITALIARLAPPNESETLHYRMARVAHWAQNRSVAHYPTAIEIQNSYSPLTEYAFLHAYILANGDSDVPVVSWLAILGCAIGVSWAAALLGADVSGQWLAALFVATLPLAIVQATSTMHEGMVAFWMVCVATEFLLLWSKRESPTWGSVFLAIAAGLGLATKPLIAPYLLPFAVATAIVLWRRTKPAQFLSLAILAIFLCGVWNAGYLWRNYQTYRVLLDEGQRQIFTNEMRNWQGVLSNLLRNAAMQASTPWRGVNYQITRLVVGIHFKLGIDVNDPRTTAVGEFWVRPINTSDSTSPAAFHAWAVLAAFLLTILHARKLGWRPWLYQVLLLGGYLSFCHMFKWQIFGTRYLLPLFVLYAPLVGMTFASRWLVVNGVLGFSLFIAAMPWLFHLQLRPLLVRPGTDYPPSLLTAPRQEFYFATAKGAYLPYRHLAERIQQAGCRSVGLHLSGTTPEYLWWVVLEAPRSQVRIEWLMAGESAKYFDPHFSPCAVISDDKPQQSFRGLPLVYTEGNLSLYLGESR